MKILLIGLILVMSSTLFASSYICKKARKALGDESSVHISNGIQSRTLWTSIYNSASKDQSSFDDTTIGLKCENIYIHCGAYYKVDDNCNEPELATYEEYQCSVSLD